MDRATPSLCPNFVGDGRKTKDVRVISVYAMHIIISSQPLRIQLLLKSETLVSALKEKRDYFPHAGLAIFLFYKVIT